MIQRERNSVSGLPRIGVGTKPVDGGHYIFDRAERDDLLEREPGAADLLRPFVGGREYINGLERWLLYVAAASPARLRSLPGVMDRIRAVRAFRTNKGGRLARSLADRPTEFHVTVAPTTDFLVIPEVSSERREYVPIGYLKPPAIPSNQLLVVENATPPLFALLTSSMHMAWLRHVGGRLESRYRYSSGLVYNTFPAPPGFASGEADLSGLEAARPGRAGRPPPPTPARPWPTSTTPTSRRPACARPTAPSTAPWTASTAAPPSPPNASAWSTCSPSTKKPARRWRRG